MALFKRKQEDEEYSIETTDLLIVFDNDNRTSDIKQIDYIDDEAVTVEGAYKVPIKDCEISVGKEGRNFFYRAPQQSINEVERLARLEQNIVLSQITSYREPEMPNATDLTKIILMGLIAVAFISIIFIA